MPVNGDAIVFATNNTPINTNNLNLAGITGITFNSGTGAFTMGGNSLGLAAGASVVNNSSNTQIINFQLALTTSASFNTASGNLTVGGAISGSSTLTKLGTSTLTLNNNGNSFSGNVTVTGGTLSTGTAAGGGTNGYLGVVNGSRTISINNVGTTVNFLANNQFGGGGKSAATIPSIAIDGGTLNSNNFNILGNVSLNNGATLTQSSTASGDYEGYQFLGAITVGGTSASTISSGNGKANHLINGTTTFNVADVTSSTATDLTVSNGLRNSSGDYGLSAGSLLKTGGGTMQLGGISTYSGNTTVSGGTLQITGIGPKLYNAGYNNSAVVQVDTGATLKLQNFAYDQSLGKLADYAARRVLNGGTIEVIGTAHSSGNNFTVNAAGGTFYYNPTVTTDTLTLTDSTNGNIQLNGMLTFKAGGNITVDEVLDGGGGGLIKEGAGTLTLNGNNSYTGATTVNDGILVVGNNSAIKSSSSLAITGATVRLDASNALGTSPWVPVTINAGGLLTQSSTLANNVQIVDLTLTGGELASGGNTGSSYGTYWWRPGAAINATGDALISATNMGADGNVDVTVSAGKTLTVSGYFADGTGGVPSLTKLGAGTMVLSGNNTYSGTTDVNVGELIVNGNTSGQGLYTVASGARLGGDGSIGANLLVASTPGELSPGDAGYLPTGTPPSGSSAFSHSYSAGTDINTVGSLGIGGDVDLGGHLLLDLMTGDQDMLNVGGEFTILNGPPNNAQLEINGTTSLTEVDFWNILGWTAPGPSIDLVTFNSFGGGVFDNVNFNEDFFDASGHKVRLGLDSDSIFLAAVPEPTSIAIWTLIGVVMAGFTWYRRRWQN